MCIAFGEYRITNEWKIKEYDEFSKCPHSLLILATLFLPFSLWLFYSSIMLCSFPSLSCKQLYCTIHSDIVCLVLSLLNISTGAKPFNAQRHSNIHFSLECLLFCWYLPSSVVLPRSCAYHQDTIFCSIKISTGFNGKTISFHQKIILWHSSFWAVHMIEWIKCYSKVNSNCSLEATVYLSKQSSVNVSWWYWNYNILKRIVSRSLPL